MIEITGGPIGRFGFFRKPDRHQITIRGDALDLHRLVATIQVAIEQGGNEAEIMGDPPTDIIVRNTDKRSHESSPRR